MSILKLEDIAYSYDKGRNMVLKDISFDFEKGKIYTIVGKSGAGKTTLLSLLAGLTSPSQGKIIYQDSDLESINKYEYRSKYVGVIFQGFNLLPQLTAAENVELSMDISRKKYNNKKEYVFSLLEKVGIDSSKANRKVLKLSGGEQQRIAIARALSYDPDIILADEPTGNLDGATQNDVMNIFKSLAYEENKCVIIVTHSPKVATDGDIKYELHPIKNNHK
ncbi:MAG: ABC transporter ATP-binding protein [Clostridium sp.]|uniref:ABC transporter ATP-binding protein n=1 Tax=Clostridium sp. TaxID=1506 RepID=UPI002FC82CA1